MLSFRPDDRPSAQQVLESAWMQKWAGPAGAVPTSQRDIQNLTTLAYQTAREHGLYPKEILIRPVRRSISSPLLLLSCSPLRSAYSGLGHSTTTIKGQFQPGPSGNHFTFCYKNEQHVQTQTHIACHGHTAGPRNYTLTKATFATEKPDSTLKRRNHKPVWPAVNELVTGPEIGYQH
ncbi:hypothetical protein J1614_000304 [Plenodomus biglobosus]|nr:hypothetical protein J1614_000304 [Plenodomus biglobosus]